MKIIFSGGGTLGPVIPLLAIFEAYKKKYPNVECIWVGTSSGPERGVVAGYHIPFFSLTSGKFRRYASLRNVVDIFKIAIGFFQSIYLLLREKPDLLISCGGYVSVPLHFAAALLAMPAWVHQQDVRIGLANKLMLPFAKTVTTALEDTAHKLKKYNAQWIGNPSRDLSIKNKEAARKFFSIPFDAPVVFALGGGTGSSSVNKLILEALPQWPRTWHVIHLVGRERPRELSERTAAVYENYHVYEFFTDEMKDAYAVADVVVCRAGFSTLTEVAALSKAAVVVPITGSHQQDNAAYFAQHDGFVVLDDSTDTGLKLAQVVKSLMDQPQRRRALGDRMHELLPCPDEKKIVEIVDNLVPYI